MSILLVTFVVIALSIVTTEAISWTFTIIHHAKWLKTHKDFERRMAVSPCVLMRTAILSCLFSLMSWAWLMHELTLFYLISFCVPVGYSIYFIFMFGSQVLLIFLWSVIANFICLPGIFWPLLSKVRSNLHLSPFHPPSTDSYIESLKEWREFNIGAASDKSLIIDFLNNLPVILWTKGLDRKYTYMSKYFYSRFGFDPYTSVVGKTGQEVAAIIKAFDSSFEGTTFDEDELRIFTDKVQVAIFVELVVNNSNISFHVINVPMYKDNEIVGLIGVAREVTWEVEQMKIIHDLFLTKRTQEGILEFEKFFADIKKYSYIKKGMAILRGENDD